MSTAKGKIYLVALTTLERLDFQYVPNIVTDSRRATLGKLAVVSRNVPVVHNTGGEEGIAMEIDFYSEQEDRRDVMEKVQWIKSLTYSDGYKRPMQKVKLIWGDLYRDEEWYVAEVRTRLSLFDSDRGMPTQAIVSIRLMRVSDKNISWSDVRR